ncbi:putative VP3 [Microviridae sp.]|nr:putative VP3 [Microviridae sp.]
MKFRTIYDEERPSPGLLCEDETLCLQYQACETSIERLVRLASQNPAYLNSFNSGLEDREPQYGECPSSFDYQDALEVIARGEEQFYNLPPELRVKFSHPVEFLAWLEDPANYDEAAKIPGLLDPEKVAKRRESLKKKVEAETVGE